MLKHRTHHSRDGNLSLYRDSHGTELDLVVDEPDMLTRIEAKSAATPKSSLLSSARRVRAIVGGIRPECDLVLMYGGSELQHRSDSRLVPWRMVRSAAPPRLPPTVQVRAHDQPIAHAEVVALFPDKTWKSARSDERGCANLNLRPGHLPLTVFVAKEGFAAHTETSWVLDECALHVQLTAQPEGGSYIASGVISGRQTDFMVKGKLVSVSLHEGERSILEASKAEGSDSPEPASGTGPGTLA